MYVCLQLAMASSINKTNINTLHTTCTTSVEGIVTCALGIPATHVLKVVASVHHCASICAAEMISDHWRVDHSWEEKAGKGKKKIRAGSGGVGGAKVRYGYGYGYGYGYVYGTHTTRDTEDAETYPEYPPP